MTSAEKVLTALPRPKSGGFFGLREFDRFVSSEVAHVAPSGNVVFDFSNVKVWDIAALLWMAVGLHWYKRQGLFSFRLRLPEATSLMGADDAALFDRSADYLRRWRFDRALKNIDPDVAKILVPEQAGYFDSTARHYASSKHFADGGLQQALVSRNLAEIRDLSDPGFTGPSLVSSHKIAECIREFQAERIGDILRRCRHEIRNHITRHRICTAARNEDNRLA